MGTALTLLRLTRPIRAALAALAALHLAGCFDSATPPAPTGVDLRPGSSFDELVLRWTPPRHSKVTGYEAEARLEDGAWERLPGQAPGDSIGAILTLMPAVPEVVTLQARVRARNGAAASLFSEPASYLRGLRPIAAASADIEGEEWIRISWSQGSSAAPQVRIERSIYDDATSTYGEFVAVGTVAPGDPTWLDTSRLLPGRSVQYRLTNVTTYQGAPVESQGLMVGPGRRPEVSPPADLRVTVVGGAPVLTWTNRSLVATALRVERAAGLVSGDPAAGPYVAFLPVAALAPDATTFTDDVPEGSYTYRVAALLGALPATSAPAHGVVPPAGLGASLLSAPQGLRGNRSPEGLLWVASVAEGRVLLWAPTADGWTKRAFQPPGTAIASPGTVLDPSGRPHLVFRVDFPTGAAPGAADLVHAWHDGSAWQQEVIARRAFRWNGEDEPGVFFALDAEGTPHVAWQSSDRAFPEHASRGATGWTVETLTSTLFDPSLAYSLLGFGAAPGGTLLALAGAMDKLLLWSRPPGGAWTEEQVPATGHVGWGEGGRLLPAAGGVTIAYRRFVQSEGAPYRLTILTKAGRDWGTPIEVAGYDISTSGLPWSAASDGTRIAVLVPQGLPEGLWLYRGAASGGWDATRLGQSTGWEPSWLGFTPAGRLWVMAPAGSRVTDADAAAGALRPYLGYTEP